MAAYTSEKTEKQCLGGMTFPKSRLDTREKIVSLKVRRHLEGDDLLNDFRDERYVGVVLANRLGYIRRSKESW